MKKTFCITTLGCKVNLAESDTLTSQLEAIGWHKADAKQADLHIINTCTVTGKAAMQSRQAVRRAVRDSKGAKIIVTGCHAQTDKGDIKQIRGVSKVIGNIEKHNIANIVSGRSEKSEPGLFEVSTQSYRSRPFLKIQDGCENFCSYCIVPYARGPKRSMSPEKVIKSLANLSGAGFKEAVLTGIHLGAYSGGAGVNFYKLLKLIKEADPIYRVRLSSIEPNELDEKIISLAADSRIFCRHFHIPLQSGSQNILQKMGRRYTPKLFAEKVENIRKSIPDAAIGADVLIGFPGETDSDFEDTLALIKSLPITYLHVFPFSARPGTPAASYNDKVSPKTIAIRCKEMRDVGRLKKEEFFRTFAGKTLEAAVEGTAASSYDLIKAMTSNYIPVLLPKNYFNDKDAPLIIPGIINTIITIVDGTTVFGALA